MNWTEASRVLAKGGKIKPTHEPKNVCQNIRCAYIERGVLKAIQIADGNSFTMTFRNGAPKPWMKWDWEDISPSRLD
jgi:hypothetical protein